MTDPIQRLKAVRILLGISMQELEQRAGLSRGELSSIESGRRGRKQPTLSTVLAVARALGKAAGEGIVDLHWLITGSPSQGWIPRETQFPELLKMKARAHDLSVAADLLPPAQTTDQEAAPPPKAPPRSKARKRKR